VFASLRDRSTAVCRWVIQAGTGGLKAAFFCLLFFAAAKKSRCRPAQGQRSRREGATRMPAKKIKTQLPATQKPNP
jgi:hypothetical protein